MCDYRNRATAITHNFWEPPVSQLPSDDIVLVSNYRWPSHDHRLVLADFLVAEADRLLARADALLLSMETAAAPFPQIGPATTDTDIDRR